MRQIFTVFAFIGMFTLFIFTSNSLSSSVATITKEELKELSETEKILIVDVRTGRDWSTSEFKIKNAIRLEGKDVSSIEKSYPKEQKVIFYCA